MQYNGIKPQPHNVEWHPRTLALSAYPPATPQGFVKFYMKPYIKALYA